MSFLDVSLSTPTPASTVPAHERQSQFMQRLGHHRPFIDLLDALTSHRFFIKDENSRFIAANHVFLKKHGFATEAQLIGLTDHAFNPPHIAQQVIETDQRIMHTRQPLINHIESIISDRLGIEWHCTTKLPLIATDGQVIGVYGISYPCQAPETQSGTTQLQPVIEHIQRHHARRILVSELAQVASTSARRLNELFRELHHMSAQQYIIHARVEAAAQSLTRTTQTLADIAFNHGFYDQSDLTRHFRKLLGETPHQFRQRQRTFPLR